MFWQYALDKEMIFFKGVYIKDFKYSVNDKIFYYNIRTVDNKDLVYKFTKEEDEEIQYLKELSFWSER